MLSRNRRMAFIEMLNDKEELVYGRMEGFTEFTVNLNPKEYTRKYIDEPIERSEVMSYQPTISYRFDMEEDSKTQEVFVYAADNESIGMDAMTRVIIVDMVGYQPTQLQGYIRDYVVIPDTEGDDSSVYTFSGTMKACSEKTLVTVESDDNWKTCNVVK